MRNWVARTLMKVAQTLAIKATSLSRSTTLVGPGARQSMPREAQGQAQEGYSENVIAFRCISIVASSFASIPVVVKVDGEETPEHPLQKLLNKPNPLMDWNEFATKATSYERITGNSFVQMIRAGGLGTDVGEGGLPQELWVWSPYYFNIIDNPSSFIPKEYIYDPGNTTLKKTWKVNSVTAACDILHFKAFNPLQKHLGMSPLVAAALSVDQHNASAKWNAQMLQNNCSPAGAVVSDSSFTDAQYDQLRKEIDEQYSGPANARRPMLLGGLSWTQFSLDMQEMDWLQGRRMSAQEISAAYGVPSQVIPIEGSQTFANYEEARLALYEDTVMPYGSRFLKALERWLRPYYKEGDRITIEFNLDSVAALAARRKAIWDTAQTSNFASLNEKREMVGLEPDENPEADALWVPAGMLPIGFDLEDGVEEVDPEANDEDEDPVEEDDEDEEDDEKRVKALTVALKKAGLNGRSSSLARKIVRPKRKAISR